MYVTNREAFREGLLFGLGAATIGWIIIIAIYSAAWERRAHDDPTTKYTYSKADGE